MARPLEGKAALITGGAKGIGSGISAALAEAGANILVNYHSSRAELEQVQQRAEAAGVRCIGVQGDVGDAGDVARMMLEAQRHYGGLDILVNNAALQMNVSLEEYTAEALARIFRVNLYGYLLCMQQALKLMKPRGGGKMVNVSSVHAKRPTHFDPGYSMTKGAIRMLTREAALEFARYRVHVNTVEFGYVDVGTKSGDPPAIIPEALADLPRGFRFLEHYPQGDIPNCWNAADAVVFLAGEGARFINGAALRVDGGNMLR